MSSLVESMEGGVCWWGGWLPALGEGVSVEGKASLGMGMWKAMYGCMVHFILGPGRNAEIGRIYNLGEDMTGSVCVC